VSAITQTLSRINQHRSLFETLPDHAFVQLNKIPTFQLKRSPILVCYKLTKPVVALPIEVDHVHPLSIGKLHYLGTGTFHFAYLLEFPHHRIVTGANIFGIARKELEIENLNAELELTDNHLNIFAFGGDALLVVDNKSLWVERAGYHGKRVKENK
jgi:hypothetical protein